MYAISTPERFISTLKGLNYLPAEKRLSIMAKVLPQMPGIKKRLGGTPAQQKAMEIALEKAQRTFKTLSSHAVPNPSQGNPKRSLSLQKISRVCSPSTIWKLVKLGGIAVGVGALIYCGYLYANSAAEPNESVPESTGRGNELAAMIRKPIAAVSVQIGTGLAQVRSWASADLLKTFQDLGISLQKKCAGLFTKRKTPIWVNLRRITSDFEIVDIDIKNTWEKNKTRRDPMSY